MTDSDAQKSEVHESTDDASSSPASNVRQQTESPPQQMGLDRSEPDVRERSRTNVAGVSPAEGDDIADAPPGHIDLNVDLAADKSFYPTTLPGTRDDEKSEPNLRRGL